jgi:flagellar basal body-associated protein FliL
MFFFGALLQEQCKRLVMMIFIVVIVAVLIVAGLVFGFGSKKEKNNEGLADPNAGNQPGPR